MRVFVALADTTRGAPLTLGRAYGELPVANKPLLAAVTPEDLIITDQDLTAYGPCCSPADAADALRSADAILPSDIFFPQALPQQQALFTVEEGSLETEAARQLLTRFHIDRPLVSVPGQRVNYPWELLTANQRALEQLAAAHAPTPDGATQDLHPSVVVEDGVVMHGFISIGAGTVIKAGSYLEGPLIIGSNCTIGPHAHLRPFTSIAENCTIGKTEVVDSVIMPRTVSKHHAYLGHSVLGVDVNVGAATVTSDYRHDGAPHTTIVGGEKVATGRRKLGAFIGDHCRLGIHTSIYPGRKLWPGCTTLPGEVVTHDKRTSNTATSNEEHNHERA